MKKDTIRLAQAQINAKVGDLAGNTEKILAYIRMARSCGADIVVFPELAVTGYPPEDLLLRDDFVQDNIKALNLLATAVEGIVAVAGFVDKDARGKIYNAAAVITGGKVKYVYHKMALPNYGVFDEKRYFTPGGRNAVFFAGGAGFGVDICEDIWVEEGSYMKQSRAGAGLLVNISASPFYAGKKKEREALVAERARRTKSYVSYTNMVGAQDELVFDGGSFIADPAGKVISSACQFKEDLLLTDIPVRGKKGKPEKGSGIDVIDLSFKASAENKTRLLKRASRKMSLVEEIYSALVLGTGDYLRKNGFKKAVIGMSGGIDSSLTAAIACDALGSENVKGVSMPSRYSSAVTRSNAEKISANLGIQYMTVSIESIYSVYLTVLEKHFAGRERDITEENLQARIRATVLMALSNKFGWMVLTTSNKSETAVGYCTLFGDMAGGFAVLKDVPKTLVYKLAEYRNRKGPKEVFPKAVFKVAPTAELRYGQTDQDTLPPYPVLDAILEDYVEAGKSAEDTAGKGHERELVNSIIKMVDSSEYKRRQAPPGVKITPKAFGRDRRLPITNGYRPGEAIG